MSSLALSQAFKPASGWVKNRYMRLHTNCSLRTIQPSLVSCARMYACRQLPLHRPATCRQPSQLPLRHPSRLFNPQVLSVKPALLTWARNAFAALMKRFNICRDPSFLGALHGRCQAPTVGCSAVCMGDGTGRRHHSPAKGCAALQQGPRYAGGAAQASSQAVATDVQKAVATALAKAFAAVSGSNSSSGSGAASGPSAGK